MNDDCKKILKIISDTDEHPEILNYIDNYDINDDNDTNFISYCKLLLNLMACSSQIHDDFENNVCQIILLKIEKYRQKNNNNNKKIIYIEKELDDMIYYFKKINRSILLNVHDLIENRIRKIKYYSEHVKK